jgi:hypothetical protein
MKKILMTFILTVIAIQSFGIVLKKVNLPENWKIKNIEKQENFKVDQLAIPNYAKEEIQSVDGTVTVHYYFCGKKELADQLYTYFFKNNKAAYKENTVIYQVEGTSEVDVKNTLRFLELPMIEQVKTTFPDIKQIQALTLQSEERLSAAEIKAMGNDFGIQIQDGLKQVFEVENSRARLEAQFFYCKDKQEAREGYKNARLKTKSDLISFLFSQEFLVRLEWIQ